ncbi:mobilome CxxCx(11)CxxC protein [Arthrobacter koreensis]|uniref:mobilome CxxCx(11)CxxC protein n=1 Tax=Arthrobacter koreensis TaxID=199136 RepID=UPI0036705444
MSEQTEPPKTSTLRERAWNLALHADGTAAIFGMRASNLKLRIRILTFAGLCIPMAVGLIVLAGIPKPSLLPYVVTLAGVLGTFQTLGSLASLVFDWNGAYAGAVRSVAANKQLSESFIRLAQLPPEEETQIAHELAVIEAQDSAQRTLDDAQQITSEEKRFGMRAALFNRAKECAQCKLTPASMNPTECGVCGDFPKRWSK